MSTAAKLQLLMNTKEAIKQAIIDKGQSVDASEPFSSYASKIQAISGGSSGTFIKLLDCDYNVFLNEDRIIGYTIIPGKLLQSISVNVIVLDGAPA